VDLFFPSLFTQLCYPAARRCLQGRDRIKGAYAYQTLLQCVPFFCFFLFHIHSSRGGVFSVGLHQENVSLLARTFLSRISTRSWVSTLPLHGAAPMGRRHMVREDGECPFRLSHIITITILARSPTLSTCARTQNSDFDHDGLLFFCAYGHPSSYRYPEEALTRTQALRGMTRDAAYAAFAEDTRGRLVPGFVADFVVLDHDIMRVPLEEILSTKVLATVVDGQVAYGDLYYKGQSSGSSQAN
jgi:hypothetical protein